jgi:hypothetical protein
VITPKDPEHSDTDDEQNGLCVKSREPWPGKSKAVFMPLIGSFPMLGSGLSFHFDDSGFLVISAVGADVMGKPWLVALRTGYDGRGREPIVRSPLVSSGL